MSNTPVADAWTTWPVSALAGSAMGAESVNVAFGYVSLCRPIVWIRWSRIDRSLLRVLTKTTKEAARTRTTCLISVTVASPVIADVRLDHQVALLARGCARVSIAVLTMYDGSHPYGKQTLKGIFARLLAHFPTGFSARRSRVQATATPKRRS